MPSDTPISQQAIDFEDALRRLDTERQDRIIYFREHGSQIYQQSGGSEEHRVPLAGLETRRIQRGDGALPNDDSKVVKASATGDSETSPKKPLNDLQMAHK
jgi:hypothetical protein